jgi:hypothetical protein
VDEAAQDVASSQLFGVEFADRAAIHVDLGWWALAEGPVRTVRVVVFDVFAEHGFKMTSSEDEHPIEALSTDGAHESLGNGLGVRLQLQPVVTVRMNLQ